MKPTAWKLESAPRPDGTRLVRACYTTEPTPEQVLIAEVEGDRYVPMVELAEAQQDTCLRYLREHGPATVAEISRATGLRREAIYAELVPLESRGVVRIVVTSEWTGNRLREWECM